MQFDYYTLMKENNETINVSSKKRKKIQKIKNQENITSVKNNISKKHFPNLLVTSL